MTAVCDRYPHCRRDLRCLRRFLQAEELERANQRFRPAYFTMGNAGAAPPNSLADDLVSAQGCPHLISFSSSDPYRFGSSLQVTHSAFP